ncbi:hypothetical protein [Nonomuraea diastatica]|nr:hypothetical protein [Nonomuraea diastatica]
MTSAASASSTMTYETVGSIARCAPRTVATVRLVTAVTSSAV